MTATGQCCPLVVGQLRWWCDRPALPPWQASKQRLLLSDRGLLLRHAGSRTERCGGEMEVPAGLKPMPARVPACW